MQPLIALKAIEAQVELAEANHDQAGVEYLQTVQTAFREVHDALVAHRSARDVLAAETDRRDDLARALEMANLRYDAGRTSYLEVLDAQRTLLAAETLRIERRARRPAVDRGLREIRRRRMDTGVVRPALTRGRPTPAQVV